MQENKSNEPFNLWFGCHFSDSYQWNVMYPWNLGLLELFILDVTLSHNWYFNRKLCSYTCGYWLSIPSHDVITYTWISSDSLFNLICIPYHHIDIYKYLIVHRFFSWALSHLTKNIQDVPRCSFEGWFSHTGRTPGSNVKWDQFYTVY